MTLKRTIKLLKEYLKMNNLNVTELTDVNKYRLDEINRQNRLMIQSNCAICGSKKSRFIKEQKALGILSNLGIKTPLSQVPLLNICSNII